MHITLSATSPGEGPGIPAPYGGYLQLCWFNTKKTAGRSYRVDIPRGGVSALSIDIPEPDEETEAPILSILCYKGGVLAAGRSCVRMVMSQAGSCKYNIGAQIKAQQEGDQSLVAELRHSSAPPSTDGMWPHIVLTVHDHMKHLGMIQRVEAVERVTEEDIAVFDRYNEECAEELRALGHSSPKMRWHTSSVDVGGTCVPQQVMVRHAVDLDGLDTSSMVNSLLWAANIALIDTDKYPVESDDYVREAMRHILCNYAVNHPYKLDSTEQWRVLCSSPTPDDMEYDCEDGSLYAIRVVAAIRKCATLFDGKSRAGRLMQRVSRMLVDHYTPILCTGVLHSGSSDGYHEYCILVDRDFATGASKTVKHPTVRLETTAMVSATLAAPVNEQEQTMDRWPSGSADLVQTWYPPSETSTPANPDAHYGTICECHSPDWLGPGEWGAAVLMCGERRAGVPLHRLMTAHESTDASLGFHFRALHPSGSTPEAVRNAACVFLGELMPPCPIQGYPDPSRWDQLLQDFPKAPPGSSVFWMRECDYDYSEAQTSRIRADAIQLAKETGRACTKHRIAWTHEPHGLVMFILHPAREPQDVTGGAFGAAPHSMRPHAPPHSVVPSTVVSAPAEALHEFCVMEEEDFVRCAPSDVADLVFDGQRDHGAVPLDQWATTALSGYRGATPVRVRGNRDPSFCRLWMNARINVVAAADEWIDHLANCGLFSFDFSPCMVRYDSAKHRFCLASPRHIYRIPDKCDAACVRIRMKQVFFGMLSDYLRAPDDIRPSHGVLHHRITYDQLCDLDGHPVARTPCEVWQAVAHFLNRPF